MSDGRGQISRRAFLSASATLIAGYGASRAQYPGTALASTPAKASAAGAAGQAGSTDLARYRPVMVSSTAYGPNPPEFAVDRTSRAWRPPGRHVPGESSRYHSGRGHGGRPGPQRQ
jgi:hypothetical protein